MESGVFTLVAHMTLKTLADNYPESKYISYSSVAVIKHHDAGNLQKEGFIWGLVFQRVRIHHHHNGEHSSNDQACMTLE